MCFTKVATLTNKPNNVAIDFSNGRKKLFCKGNNLPNFVSAAEL